MSKTTEFYKSETTVEKKKDYEVITRSWFKRIGGKYVLQDISYGFICSAVRPKRKRKKKK